MEYIDHTGQGNTMLILTDAESRLMRKALEYLCATDYEHRDAARQAFRSGIARALHKMTEEAKKNWDEQRARTAK